MRTDATTDATTDTTTDTTTRRTTRMMSGTMSGTMAVCLIRCYERLATAYESCTTSMTNALRRAVGPAPERIVLMANGDVTRVVYGLDVSAAYLYDPATRQIRPFVDRAITERRRPVPFVALTITQNGTTRDLSEWVGELRSVPLPFTVTATQLVDLWCLAHHAYIASDAQIQYTTNTGDEGTVRRTRS